MTGDNSNQLAERLTNRLNADINPAVERFAHALAQQAGARAVLFYGSNLRTGSLDGVLDFYVLRSGSDEPAIWPVVSYHEREDAGIILRAKVAAMTLETFAKAAAGELRDTTIWARFVQPSALVWQADESAAQEVAAALSAAAQTAAQLAAALGPETGTAEKYWRALFQATYKAEFRVEKPGRENDILSVNAEHFRGLLPLALSAAGIAFDQDGERITPHLPEGKRSEILNWWRQRQRLGKPLNFLRLLKASTTFEGASRYAAWKIERHTGMPVEITPFREKYPILAAPGVLVSLWRHKRAQSRAK
ncbi:hypothetical protein [Erythrobacter sp. MTPC3]|uniref:hypothetical protein n=1 Tax=Erythrobacter sp. MTPC3 TaxID=3056564 RepID=UPI0036F414F5